MMTQNHIEQLIAIECRYVRYYRLVIVIIYHFQNDFEHSLLCGFSEL